MKTLLLRLAAPMQSWGDESKYNIRGTRREPTKSGVIGMIAAAMGLSRDDSNIAKLAEKIRLGVRVDQPGTIIMDYHTVRVPKYSSNGSLRYNSDGSIIMIPDTLVTYRYYLCDAVFLVGLESNDDECIERIDDALKNPIFPLYLGRRSCPVTFPFIIGKKDCDLESALRCEDWIASDWYKEKYHNIHARIITETPKGMKAWHVRMDQPVSFNPIHRRYSMRGLNKEQYILLGKPEHDPMSIL